MDDYGLHMIAFLLAVFGLTVVSTTILPDQPWSDVAWLVLLVTIPGFFVLYLVAFGLDPLGGIQLFIYLFLGPLIAFPKASFVRKKMEARRRD